MKTRITSILAIVMVFIATSAFAGTQTAKIKTNAVCGECKERIETALFKVDGVKSAKLDLKTDIITIKYNDTKTSEAALRKSVSEAGYNADDVAANAAAHESLPACCKIEVTPKHDK